MNKPKNSLYTYAQLLLIFFGLFFTSSALFSIIYRYITVFLEAEETTLVVLRMLTVQFGAFLVPSLLFFRFFSERMFYRLTVRDITLKKWGGILLIVLGGGAISEFFLYLNQQIHIEELYPWVKQTQEQARETIELVTQGGVENFVRNIFLMCLLPAIGEELSFRGVLQPLLILMTKKALLAIIAVSFLFAFIHFDFTSFLPRFILSVLYGYTVYVTGNIAYSVVFHFINNLTALSWIYIAGQESFPPQNFYIITAYFVIGGMLISYGLKVIQVKTESN